MQKNIHTENKRKEKKMNTYIKSVCTKHVYNIPYQVTPK